MEIPRVIHQQEGGDMVRRLQLSPEGHRLFDDSDIHPVAFDGAIRVLDAVRVLGIGVVDCHHSESHERLLYAEPRQVR